MVEDEKIDLGRLEATIKAKVTIDDLCYRMGCNQDQLFSAALALIDIVSGELQQGNKIAIVAYIRPGDREIAWKLPGTKI
jgi:hypothetical protein